MSANKDIYIYAGADPGIFKGGRGHEILRGGGCPCERRKRKALRQSVYRKKWYSADISPYPQCAK